MLLVSVIKPSLWLDNLPLSYTSAPLTAVPLFFQVASHCSFVHVLHLHKAWFNVILVGCTVSLSVTSASICGICAGVCGR